MLCSVYCLLHIYVSSIIHATTINKTPREWITLHPYWCSKFWKFQCEFYPIRESQIRCKIQNNMVVWLTINQKILHRKSNYSTTKSKLKNSTEQMNSWANVFHYVLKKVQNWTNDIDLNWFWIVLGIHKTHFHEYSLQYIFSYSTDSKISNDVLGIKILGRY